MEERNYNILSNNELTQIVEEYTAIFEIAQNNLKENYETMVNYSNEIIKIKDILNKRGVKI